MKKTTDLPVAALVPEVLAQLGGAKLVLQAPPGAGKSTYLPLALLQQGRWQQRRILLLQPRRLAAVTIAHYLAEQLGEPVGESVGYHVRGEQCFQTQTRLLVITEGIFVQYLQHDPELSNVAVVLFDEFHERNLFSDLGLAMLLEALPLRPDLGVLIMSATLPAETIAAWLGDAKVLQSEGRQHPITLHHRAPKAGHDWLSHCAQVISEALQTAERGVLVFLPGWREIHQLHQRLQLPAEVLPLHRQLPLASQQAALREPSLGQKKVVLATNIAETSLTIPGIDVVVDSGRERRSIFYPRHGISRLQTQRISKASATQRAGRAGRLGPGQCYRLWSQSDEHSMRDYDDPALVTDDLSSASLEAKRWGSELQDMQFLSPPNPVHLQVAIQQLKALGIVDEQDNLTALGQRVASYGAEPRIARIAVAVEQANEQRRGEAALLLAQLEHPPRQPEQFPLRAEQLQGETRKRWKFWCQKFRVKPSVTDITSSAAAELALWGYGDRIARRRGENSNDGTSYRLAYGGGGKFHHADTRRGDEWLLVLTMNFTEAQTDAIIGCALSLTEADLAHPALTLAWQQELQLSGPKQRFEVVEVQRLGAILVAQRVARTQPSNDERVQLLVDYVQAKNSDVIDWQSVTYLLARLRLAQNHLADHERQAWPDFSDRALLDELAGWAAPYWQPIKNLAELRRWSPKSALLARLNYQQRQLLDELCPQHWLAPSGHRHLIHYQTDGAEGIPNATANVTTNASVALKLQEVFGAPVSPTICRGEVTLTLELLSPAGRPLQRTSDLASFWQNAYQQVKKEMKGRYPKHPWPDDPQQAQATRKTNRFL
ncbi:ATP-dependent helicase HrpB [Pseudidiomarina sp. E22-M8]|uniref:ATP-dependent helicase HrpB n=1 Tax=Pseudidiomarina sp. E22-M8 TaxID=3424768 RepID=UPI00403C7E61